MLLWDEIISWKILAFCTNRIEQYGFKKNAVVNSFNKMKRKRLITCVYICTNTDKTFV